MKSILSKFAAIALFALAFAPAVFAEEDRAPQTLLSVTDLRFSGYGGPVIRGTSLDGEPSLIMGGRGGVIINDSARFNYGDSASWAYRCTEVSSDFPSQ